MTLPPERDPRLSRAPLSRVSTVGLWASMFAIFTLSPVIQMNDSTYSMLTALSLVRYGTPDLSHYSIPGFDADLPFSTVHGSHAYQLARTNGRLLYGYPHGTSFLSVPFVACMELLGVSPATRDLTFDVRGEARIQKMLAAILSALVVTVFFRTALLVLDLPWSLLVAAGAGLGTQVWSTASRGMWQHTWEIMLGSCVVYLLVVSEIRRASVRPILLATLLSWMFFVRPTGAIAVVCVSGYVFARRRRELVAFGACGIFWLLLFEAYWLRIFGAPLPVYYLSNDPRSLGVHMGVALYGTLFSPSRGIFVFCPIIAWIFFLLVRFWRYVPSRSLAIVSLCTVGGVLMASLINAEWWGGACYGPRLLTDAVPWLVLLAILGIDAIPLARRKVRTLMIATGALLLMVSVAMNAIGAFSLETIAWNLKGPSPAIMLDWTRPQFLAGWFDQP
jgi:hypothetical protein